MMRDALRAKAEWRWIDVARLLLESRPVNAAPVKPRRSTRLQPAAAQPEILQRLAEQYRGRLARAPRRILLLATMNESVKKSSRRDDDSGSADGAAVAKSDAENPASAVRRLAFGNQPLPSG